MEKTEGTLRATTNGPYAVDGWDRLIPRLIADEYTRGRTEGGFRAVTLFIDISGFTAMTDRLMLKGKKGAEVLSIIINTVFSPLIDAVYSANGFVASFAGDAFTAVFPESLATPAAVFAAAARMQLTFRDRGVHKTPWEDFTLGARIGLGEGDVKWQIFKFEEQAGYLFSGAAIEECAKAEHACRPGCIVYPSRSDFTQLTVDDPQPVEGTGFIMAAVKKAPAPLSKPTPPGPVSGSDLLRHFLPVDQLPQSATGEFRTIISVFIAYDEKTISPETVFNAVIRSGREKGAYLNLIDSGDKGGVQLVLFGAPQAFENRDRRALDFALELAEALPGVRTGIAGGQAYTGFVGSPRRGTYTALGSVVNLSARLAMTAKAGEVLVSGTLLRGSKAFGLEKERSASFRGIAGELTYGNLHRLKGAPSDSSQPGIGREEELKRLRDWTAKVFRQSSPEGLLVSGEAGIGKSQLTEDLLRSLDPGLTKNNLVFNSLFQRGFGPLRDYFSRIFLGRTEAEVESLIGRLHGADTPDYLVNELGRAAQPLLDLAGGVSSDTAYRALDVEARYERTIEALVAWFEILYLKSPGLLCIDQAQSMDANTRDFLQRLAARCDSLALCIIYMSRDSENTGFPGVNEERVIHLAPFSDKEIELAAERELKARAGDELTTLLRKRSAGIPLHIFALLHFLRTRGMLRFDGGRMVLSGVSGESLPATINDLTISQYDSLPSEAKQIIPLLAAAGNRLPARLLDAVDIRQSGPGITALTAAGILEESGPDTLVFRKEYMREAVYAMQLSETLKELHARLFAAWRKAFPEKEEYSLEKGYHAEESSDTGGAREYYLLAAREAQARFSNDEAVELFNRFIRLDPQNPENTDVRLHIAEIYDLVGQWDKAYEELVKGVGFALLSNAEDELHRFFALGGQILLQQSRIPQAKELLLKSVRDSRARGINPARIKARIDLARVHLLEGAYTDAMNRLFEARDMSQESGYLEGQGLSTYYLGRVYSVRNRRTEAAEFYTRAREIFTELNKPRLMANPLYDLGLLNRNEGNLEAARAYLEEALDLYVRIGYKSGISAALLNIGLIYDQQGEFTRAEEYFSRSLTIAREIGEQLAVAFARFSLGASAYKEGNLEQSLDFLSEAHRMITELGAETYRGYTLSYLSSLLVRMGRSKEAIEYISGLHELIRATGEDPEHGRLYLALGALVRDGVPEETEVAEVVRAIAEAEGIDPPNSIQFYKKAVEISKAARYVDTLIPALIRLGEQLKKHKHAATGLKYIRKAQHLAKKSGWMKLHTKLSAEYGPGL